MKTLYISDLDGTLLRSDQRLSTFTAETINRLVEEGMYFSYATARSIITARKATEGLSVRIPLILYNGVFIMENETNRVLLSNVFEKKSVCEMLRMMVERGVLPIVYSLKEGRERFAYLEERINQPTRDFIETRKDDPRKKPIYNLDSLMEGEIYYVTCIGEPKRLERLYEEYRNEHKCIFHEDVYSHEMWLEIMPKAASKANAIAMLKEKLGCDRVVCFGDGKNDISMFEAADECYAVANAVDELKATATGIIGTNDSDGVAKWLLENAQY